MAMGLCANLKPMKRALLIGLLAFAAPALAQTLYRWVDPDGKVHYSDKPPPASAKDVRQRDVRGQGAEAAALPYATQAAAKNFPVTLYTTDCGDPCKQARDLLRKRGIPHTEKNPQQPAEQEELVKLLSGQLEVPVLKVGKSVVRGWDEAQWTGTLDAAGYPKSAGAPPPKPAPKPAAPKAEAPPAEEGAEEQPAEAPPPAEPAPVRRGPYPVHE